jgi:hypothetical protein
MGLLDDAIREHLELKRLRGADPGDVAREEQAALGPVHRGGEAESQGPQAKDAETVHSDESLPPGSDAAPASDSSAGQETIEINMEAELAASRAAPVAHPVDVQAASGESLEWEMPGDRRVGPMPGNVSQGDADSGGEAEHGVDGPVEDVLEETPDFLRDTPEQERLWFEQRPPRDFDFNE